MLFGDIFYGGLRKACKGKEIVAPTNQVKPFYKCIHLLMTLSAKVLVIDDDRQGFIIKKKKI